MNKEAGTEGCNACLDTEGVSEPSFRGLCISDQKHRVVEGSSEAGGIIGGESKLSAHIYIEHHTKALQHLR